MKKKLSKIKNGIQQKPSNKLPPKTPAAQLALPNLYLYTYKEHNQNPNIIHLRSLLRKPTEINSTSNTNQPHP